MPVLLASDLSARPALMHKTNGRSAARTFCKSRLSAFEIARDAIALPSNFIADAIVLAYWFAFVIVVAKIPLPSICRFDAIHIIPLIAVVEDNDLPAVRCRIMYVACINVLRVNFSSKLYFAGLNLFQKIQNVFGCQFHLPSSPSPIADPESQRAAASGNSAHLKPSASSRTCS